MSDVTFEKIDNQILNAKLSSDYYLEYYKKDFKDYSFAINHDNELIGYCICYQIERKLCIPFEGVKLNFISDIWKTIHKLQNKIQAHLDAIATQNGCSEVIVMDALDQSKLTDLGQGLLNANYNSRLVFEMTVGLKDFNEEVYYTKIRKSYKSLINWGRRSLEVTIIDRQNLSFERFIEFKKFHEKISGRQTRSDESWNIQYQMLEHGYGELILADYEGVLVAGSLFIDQFERTIYFTGVYERELFDYGISHYLLYHGICRSAARGNTSYFSLGCYETEIMDRKLYNIQFFKKGFAENLAPTILWRKVIGVESDITIPELEQSNL